MTPLMGPLLELSLPVVTVVWTLPFLLRSTADFKLSIGTLRVRGVLPSGGDIQLQTEHLASQVRFFLNERLLL